MEYQDILKLKNKILYMKKSTIYLFVIGFVAIFFFSCSNNENTKREGALKVIGLNPANFSIFDGHFKIDTIDCTLSTGEKSKCLQIITNGIQTNHEMGPWCPETITDTKEKGGIWIKDGNVYPVDGEFIHNLAVFYEDEYWLMYDEDGHILRTKTKEDCLKLAGAQLVDEYTNHCIECMPEYVRDLSKVFVLPLNPVLLDEPIILNRPPPKKGEKGGDRPKERPSGPPPGKGGKGGKGGPRGPAMRGIALNGVAFDAPAPLHLILGGYTIPPLDQAGGHINMDAGYHYHAATGLSTELKQPDGHAPLLGYAMDGIGLYAYKNIDGIVPNDLDECRGHFDEIRGYHYHVDAAGNNNFINCFSGAIATNE